MLDPKFIRSNPEKVKEKIQTRGIDISIIDDFLKTDERWRNLTYEVDQLKARRNLISEKIAELKKSGHKVDNFIAEMKGVSDRIKELDNAVKEQEEKTKNILLQIPNLPHSSAPTGKDKRDNLEIRRVGQIRPFDFPPKSHAELGVALGILNFEQSAKMSGSRFVVYHGLGARLEWALINFMLDLHTKEHGYKEVLAPFLVNSQSMMGTGQLPKFEEDLFKTVDGYYLIPTSEVSITNLHREEIIPPQTLPLNYVSYSPCFRREAGSYGKEVRGIIRQHQFNKVELVKFVEPRHSYEELERLTLDAEEALKRLELPYRVVCLCTAEMGFAASKTYDLEVWFPSEREYKEISSCSNFEDFQARRAEIRFRATPESKPEFVHTLNGSGLAVGRTFAAILENYQDKDGRIVIPEVLKPYLNGLEVI